MVAIERPPSIRMSSNKPWIKQQIPRQKFLAAVPIRSGRRKSQCFRHQDSGQHIALSERDDALRWFKLVPAQAPEDALHASSRSMNEQASAESRMRVVGTAMGTTRNQLKTERISTQAEADARCTQWHRLCLTPF
jgi:hypothetical protein